MKTHFFWNIRLSNGVHRKKEGNAQAGFVTNHLFANVFAASSDRRGRTDPQVFINTLTDGSIDENKYGKDRQGIAFHSRCRLDRHGLPGTTSTLGLGWYCAAGNRLVGMVSALCPLWLLYLLTRPVRFLSGQSSRIVERLLQPAAACGVSAITVGRTGDCRSAQLQGGLTDAGVMPA